MKTTTIPDKKRLFRSKKIGFIEDNRDFSHFNTTVITI